MPKKTHVNNFFKSSLKLFFFLIVALNLYLGSWYVLNGDLTFSSDVARDFFLYQEVTAKKIVLIGPHSSSGLFHGPLWTYLNYPAYLIGHGNPVAVGWYWIFLIAIFLIGNFYLARSLFGNLVAYLFVMMESGYLAFHAHLMNNPHGAMLVIPAFFFFFVRYWETGKLRYLFWHLLTGAAIVQFQMAVGIPFVILSFFAVLVKCLRSKKYFHIFTFFLLAIPLGNFIIFDIRHNFLLSKLVLDFISPQQGGHAFNYLLFFSDRVRLMLSSMEIIRLDRGYRNLWLSLFLLVLILRQIKDNKYKTVYLSFLYFYAGFFALSFINKGALLYFYLFPLFPFVHLIFVSLFTSRYKPVFLIVFSAILIFNLTTLINDDKETDRFRGIDLTSWKFLFNMAKNVYGGPEKEFGYFAFSPDIVGFGPKYAMKYTGEIYKKPSYSFRKKPVTYLIAEPHTYYKSDWWRINKAHITNTPVSAFVYPNGYKIEKYLLTPEEIKIPPEPDIDPGIFFR